MDDDTVYYSKSGQNISSETKVELLDTNVIYNDYSLLGNGDGYALFDLRGKYSKMSFDIGRINEYEMQAVILYY